MPTGLGSEVGWWCPTLDTASDGLTNLVGGASATLKMSGKFGVVSDSGAGGSEAWEADATPGSGINTGTPPLINNSFSMSCWFKQDTATIGFMNMMAVESPVTRDYLQVRTNTGAMATDFNGLSMSGTTDLRGTWHHVSLTFDYATNAAEQYIDGINVNSGSMVNGWNQNLGEWEIGSQGRSGGTVFDGLLDDARIYNQVLTAAEITHLATSRGVQGPPGGAATNYNPFRNAKYINKTYQIPRFG